VDEFMRHFNGHQHNQKPSEDQYQIYNVKMVLDWIKEWEGGNFPEYLQQVQNMALDAVKERALELGRQDWLEDPWGSSAGKQARRERLHRDGVVSRR